MVNVTEIINIQDGFSGIASHACSSTDGLIAWISVFSIWLLLIAMISFTDEKHWAVGAASFVGLIFAIGFAIFGCSGAVLIIVMILGSVLGLAGGYISS